MKINHQLPQATEKLTAEVFVNFGGLCLSPKIGLPRGTSFTRGL